MAKGLLDLRDHYDHQCCNLWSLGLWEKFQLLSLKDMLLNPAQFTLEAIDFLVLSDIFQAVIIAERYGMVCHLFIPHFFTPYFGFEHGQVQLQLNLFVLVSVLVKNDRICLALILLHGDGLYSVTLRGIAASKLQCKGFWFDPQFWLLLVQSFACSPER